VTSTIEPDDRAYEAPRSDRRLRPLTVAAVASLSAGAVHAGAVGAHAEHPVAAKVFVAVALFQLGWGGLALVRRERAVALVGAVGNALLVGGWILAKWKGLSFIEGLDEVEPIQFADSLCAALATLAAVGAATLFFGFRLRRGQPLLASGVVAVLALAALPGMIEAGNHVHQHDEATLHGHVHDEATATAHVHTTSNTTAPTGMKGMKMTPSAVAPKPYDPKKPIDLGGIKGVSLAEQARAENLVAETVVRLPQWSDPTHAEALGFKSIGDGITGIEHLINWSYINDDHVLDPDHPESLVYRVKDGKRTLVSAMYMLKPGSNLNTVPDIGGKLTQWHIHDNLCFTNDKVAPHVVGITDAQGNCPQPFVKLPPVPMIHVWIVSHPCGPFAALDGVGAGQIKPGEERLCDHVHGMGGGL